MVMDLAGSECSDDPYMLFKPDCTNADGRILVARI